MKKTYVYRIKHKFVKHPELLEAYGFIPYQDADLDEEEKKIIADNDIETIYARPISLNKDGAIYKYLIAALEKIYEHATTQEREEDFGEYEFKEVVEVNNKGVPKTVYKMTITSELEKELRQCQLCYADKGLGANTLFINAPDTIEYYNVKDLDENCKDLIETLIYNKIIYKKRVNRNAR